MPARSGAPAVLLCHRNAGNISHRLDRLEIFRAMRLAALAVLLFDHRGYGRSNGTPNEQGTYLDAQAACDYLTNTKGLLPKSIVIIGESLGDHDTEFPVSKPKLIKDMQRFLETHRIL